MTNQLSAIANLFIGTEQVHDEKWILLLDDNSRRGLESLSVSNKIRNEFLLADGKEVTIPKIISDRLSEDGEDQEVRWESGLNPSTPVRVQIFFTESNISFIEAL